MKLEELQYILSDGTKLDIEAHSKYCSYTNIASNIEMKDLDTYEYKDKEIEIMCPAGYKSMIVVLDMVID